MAVFRAKKKAKAQLRQYAEAVQFHAGESELITQELYRKNVELAHTNRTLSLLRTIDNLVLESENTLEDLAGGITDALIQNSAYLFSAIFVRDDRYKNSLPLKGISFSEVVSVTASEETELLQLEVSTKREWFARNEQSELIAETDLDNQFLQDVFASGSGTAAVVLRKCNVGTLSVTKLMARQKLVGVMIVGVSEVTDRIRIEELEHLGRIAEASGLAIDNKLLTEENIAVLRKLKVSNTKLRALDEAKDEFISMASHQLRTPLTSVKGYLSMLAEGDAGELNATQKKFIDQAFISSQRMVYLIADLLNVSRLKTGKFIIEAAPTYLPDVIESETAQLHETVKSRGLTMSFDKPNEFTMLNLDETKIRQVIMNFTDNAIYYTPSGGSITLQLSETEKSVQFTVHDTGLGVPKADQPHLFTKFYRAGNARKARPDGTGLGLYMAKKVIVAQGGSILFKSTEGKGSMFGFTFPKAKLVTKDIQ